MPLPMVHLSVAKKIIEYGFEVKNASQFYLGSISPDAIHMRLNSDRLAKKATHLVVDNEWDGRSEDDFFIFVHDFIVKNKDNADVDFLWGYGIHVLTDRYWINRVHVKFLDDYKKDTKPIQDERMAYYNDTDIIDHILFNEYEWTKEVWLGLQNADCFDFFGLLSSQEIHLWNERTLHWYDGGSRHKNPVKYIHKTDIEDFIDLCAKIIWNYAREA